MQNNVQTIDELARYITPLTLGGVCRVEDVLGFEGYYYLDAYLKSGQHISISNEEPENFTRNLTLEVFNVYGRSVSYQYPLDYDDVIHEIDKMSREPFVMSKLEHLAYCCNERFGTGTAQVDDMLDLDIQYMAQEVPCVRIACDGDSTIVVEEHGAGFQNLTMIAMDKDGNDFPEFAKEGLSLSEALACIVDTRVALGDYWQELMDYYNSLEYDAEEEEI